MFIQEHWLLNDQSHIITDNLSNVNMVFVSGMSDTDIRAGRPYGGCAIVWKTHLSCNVEPINCLNNRLCGAKCVMNEFTFLLFTVYMPCDASYDRANLNTFEDVLREIIVIATNMNINNIFCGGDFNTDLSRTNSLHTKSLTSFVENEHLVLLDTLVGFDVEYSYESKATNSRSLLDHFIVSQNITNCVVGVKSDISVDNLSDHCVISAEFNIETQYLSSENFIHEDKLLWEKATDLDLSTYKFDLDAQLNLCHVPVNAFACRDHFCTDHNHDLQLFHDNIVKSCLVASACIPKSKGQKTPIPGWSEYIKPYRDQSIFWHKLWQDNGSPRAGIIADIRRKTRAQYHNELKRIRRHENDIRFSKLANSFHSDGQRDFWAEIKKLRGRSTCTPNNIDGTRGANGIADLFSCKYKHLYNSVPYDIDKMNALKNGISQDIVNKSSNTTFVNVDNVCTAMSLLKLGKHDGNKGHFTNHLIHGTYRLFCYMSLLFNSMISHGYVPDDFLLSTLIPIPKSKRKSLNCSDNYRAIALSSVMGKLLDHIIMRKCKDVFTTSHYQFGFKKSHSTLVVNETIQYYINNNSHIYATLLDASRAFDRVEYVKLFQIITI